MDAKSILRQCLMDSKMSQRELSKRMDIEERLISQRLTRAKDLKTEWLNEALEYLGYSVNVIKLDYKRVSPRYYKEYLSQGKMSDNANKKYYCLLNDGSHIVISGNKEKRFFAKVEALDWLKKEGKYNV